MAMVKAQFLLPTHDNDGRALAAEIAAVMDRIYDRFHGWTLEATVRGVFRMADGSKKVDVCERYMVLFDATRIEELEQELRLFKAQTQQEAIYLEIQQDVDVRFI